MVRWQFVGDCDSHCECELWSVDRGGCRVRASALGRCRKELCSHGPRECGGAHTVAPIYEHDCHLIDPSKREKKLCFLGKERISENSLCVVKRV